MPYFRIERYSDGWSSKTITAERIKAKCFRDAISERWRSLTGVWHHCPEVPDGQTPTSRAYRYSDEFCYYLVVKIED